MTIILGALGFDFQTALSLAVTNICNAGPLIQILAPDFAGYASLSLPVKWLMTAAMVVGRLEIVMILLLFTPAFWKN